MSHIELYDTTLRDGAQYEGISLSVEDKLAITRKLDQLGVHYIEGGWPGSNPKDAEYFRRVKGLNLSHATLAAFGSTRRAKTGVEQDANIRALLDADTPVVTLVGKSWDLHVTRVLETSLEENLAMIADSVSYLRAHGRRVFFDAEHFFDGFKANPDYAIQCVRTAAQAGAECVALCDTNGGTLPDEIADIVRAVRGVADMALGIHTHNDADTAVAGALAAVRAGVTQVQGTVNGYGERCGNANLLSIIANLKLKMGIACISAEQLEMLTEVSRYVAEVANMPHTASQPYAGASAFAHKGGLHASGVSKVEHSYQHVPPEVVGNAKRVLVSELSGRGNILYKVREMCLDVELTQAQAGELLEQVKLRESEGFQYEGAEASFELLVRRMLPGYEPPFSLVDFMAVVEKRSRPGGDENDLSSQAMIKVRVGGEVMHTAAEGNGPVNALDNALRKALTQFYPSLKEVRLVDYKVRVVDQGLGTGAVVRVLIESTDGRRTWSTVGSSHNIIEASWLALADSLEYWLARHT
jgi:2-isopropylmalate synthase